MREDLLFLVVLVGQLLLNIVVAAGSNLATQTVVLSGGVVLPLKRTMVGKSIGATLGYGSNVVYLPSVLAGSVAVISPTYPGTALVLTPNCRVVIGDDLCLLPDSKFSFFAKNCHFKNRFKLNILHP